MMILCSPNPDLIFHPSLYPYLVIHVLYINSNENIVFSSRFYLHLILVKDHNSEEMYKPFVEGKNLTIYTYNGSFLVLNTWFVLGCTSSDPNMCPFSQWNETIKLFRGGMPLRRHWAHFRCYDWSFTGSEAVDYLHELLRRNNNFGPEVTRYQTLQLLRKFLKAHVIEDIKGRHGTENFEDSGQLYRQVLTVFTHQ